MYLTTAINAAIEAGNKILNIYNGSFNVNVKGDNSPLTEADLASNEVINRHLQTTGLPIISEENKEVSYETRKNWQTCWMVDPLDGTKEFIKRNGEFTVNIALIEKGSPVMGVIYVPATKELYYATVSDGKAFKYTVEPKTTIEEILNKAVPLKPALPAKKIVKVVGSRSHMSDETQAFINTLSQQYDSVEMVSKGSSLKFCLLAEGLAHVYPRYAPTMEWDTAAGHAICKALGIKVISVETDEELQYNKPDLLNSYFVAR